MKTYKSNEGLLVDESTTPPTCAGYIFNFTGHGAFEPSGCVQLQNGNGVVRDLEQAEIDEHNRLLGQAEIAGLDKCEVGQWGTLYWSSKKGVTTWTGLFVANYTLNSQQSVLTFKRNGRTYRGRLQKDADCFSFKRIA